MPLKVEPSTPSPETASPPHVSFLNSSSYQSLWSAANFATVAMATSTGVVCVQSPIKTMITSLSKSNVLVPAYKGGVLGCLRMLYNGTQASLGSNYLRSAYATSTKSNKPESVREEVAKEEAHRIQAAYIASAAFGEVAVTQIPSTLSDYKKANIIPSDFKWWTPYNVTQLIKGNFGVKYCSSLMGCYALCVIEPTYADHFNFVPPHIARFLSGACSGMTAAVVNYPLAAFIDYTQVRTVLKGDKLVNKGALNSLQDLSLVFWADPKASLFAFFLNAAKQVPLRMISSGAIFSMVAGIGNALGQEPLRAVVPAKYIPIGSNSSTFFNKNTSKAKQQTPGQSSDLEQGVKLK